MGKCIRRPSAVIVFFTVFLLLLSFNISSAVELQVKAEREWVCGEDQTRNNCVEKARRAVNAMALANYKVEIRSFSKLNNFNLENDELIAVVGGSLHNARYKTHNLGGGRFKISVTGVVITEEVDFRIEEWLQKNNAGSCPNGMSYIPHPSSPYCIDQFEYPNTPGKMPLRGASWYDAKRKCEAEGKYLCSEGEWQTACQGPQRYRQSLNLYPYGQSYDYNKCRTDQGKKAGPSPCGSYRGCKSGYSVFDMSGNLREWVDEDYDAYTGEKVLRGGDFSNGANLANCNHRHHYKPSASYNNFGFRCCGKPSR